MSGKLQNLPQIDQKELLEQYKFAIEGGENVLVFGPSGCGKTELAIQSCKESQVPYVYWNLSVCERPDLQGVPKIEEDRVIYATPKNLPYAGGEQKVIIFDESDKAPPEILQPLLELLQFHRINDQPLNIKSIFLTGNLPDEFAHSEPLSHALTNRCNVFELVPDLKVWLQWAIRNNIHPVITGFLSKAEHAEFFIRQSRNNQQYCYNYPTPRSWTASSRMICRVQKNDDKVDAFQYNLLASRVGVEAANKVKIWLEYYQQLELTIDKIFKGEEVDTSDLGDDQIFVCAIGALSRLNAWIKDKTPEESQERAVKVFSWTKNLHMDLQIAAYRGTCDAQVFLEKGFEKNEYLKGIWKEIRQLAKSTE